MEGKAPPARATLSLRALTVTSTETQTTERYQRAALDAIGDAWLFLRAERDDTGTIADFVVIDLNAAAERSVDRPRDTLVGIPLRTGFPMHADAVLFGAYRDVATSGTPRELERCIDATCSDERWLHVTIVHIPDGVAVRTRDISERRRADAARARLAAILDASPDIVAISGIDGRVQYLNGAGRAMLGLPPDAPADDVYDLRVADFQPQLLPGGALEEATRRAVRDGVWRGETTLHKRDGREVPVEQVLLAHVGADGRPAFFSSVMRDITDRKQAEAALRSLSLVDELTGLYNRRGFLTVAGQALDRARERGAPVLVFYMDMDAFKAINDAHGHGVGDAALREVADVLRTTFRESDVIGRIGGDEFVAFAVHGVAMDSGVIARAVIARIEQRLGAANVTRIRPYVLSLSVGVSSESHTVAPSDGTPTSIEQLLASADAALLEEKSRRRIARARGAA